MRRGWVIAIAVLGLLGILFAVVFIVGNNGIQNTEWSAFKPESMEQDNYYRVILQNLFFATLNCQPDKRKFVSIYRGMSKEQGVKTCYRYADELFSVDEFQKLMKPVPFLNCALFDCLDKTERPQDGGREILLDGFSSKPGKRAHVPNGLFFDEAKGLIKLFSLYEFTVDENAADDSDVALDPELLGKVFENLLGAFNPETQETARKATGSFYTPREIVDYMVEESIRNYLKSKVPGIDDERLDDLFDKARATEGAPTKFNLDETNLLLNAPEPAVDGNVLRVITRLTACDGDIADAGTKRMVKELLRTHYPEGYEAGLLTEGIMELGETVCLPNGIPRCEVCPLASLCTAHREARELAFPVKTPGKPRRIEEKTVLLLRCGRRFAIRRRPGKGLLAGLWEFPTLDGSLTQADVRRLAADRKLSVRAMNPCGKSKHVFTHVEWHMSGFLLDCETEVPGFVWRTPEEIAADFSLPAAFRPWQRIIN